MKVNHILSPNLGGECCWFTFAGALLGARQGTRYILYDRYTNGHRPPRVLRTARLPLRMLMLLMRVVTLT